jgi:hypothetical protein
MVVVIYKVGGRLYRGFRIRQTLTLYHINKWQIYYTLKSLQIISDQLLFTSIDFMLIKLSSIVIN